MGTERFAFQELSNTLQKLEHRMMTAFDQTNDRITALESRLNTQLQELEERADKRAAALVTSEAVLLRWTVRGRC